MTQKYIRNNSVAVLFSPDYGAGWSTWNTDYGEDILFDPWIVDVLLSDADKEEKAEKIRAYCALRYSNLFLGGLDRLAIAWVPQGSMFKVVEYDGKESIEYRDSEEWIQA
jgi:hypothetical protein